MNETVFPPTLLVSPYHTHKHPVGSLYTGIKKVIRINLGVIFVEEVPMEPSLLKWTVTKVWG